MKKLLLLCLPFLMMSCQDFDYKKLEVNQTLTVVDTHTNIYQQNANNCYINSSHLSQTINGQIYYSVNGNDIKVKITGDYEFTIYHLEVVSYCVK